ncbi:hypothetical protein [Pontibacillus litoralis]|uniref:Lipoprotein n=1 Tax=Pontibacillus litoralis JSM 072002 TaxID=1385512 RepID=A0A0A5G703_9BACI|nr:hypothetical protein [Pontibacillus litoralis]KGX86943.1 hypothetical protein N784_03510 [Pontibacillus litoralis JSM 072002]
MRGIYTIVVVALFLIACTQEEQTTVAENQQQPISPETDDEDQNAFTYPEIKLEAAGVNYAFPTKELPLLYTFLQGAGNPGKQIEEMKLVPLPHSDPRTSYFVIQYGCVQTDLCSQLFVKRTADALQSKLVGDLVSLQSAKFSPDESHVLLTFAPQASTRSSFSNNNPVIINTARLTKVETTSPNSLSKRQDWPILDSKWINNEHIELTIPNVASPSNEVLQKQEYFDDSNVQSITLTINDDKEV